MVKLFEALTIVLCGILITILVILQAYTVAPTIIYTLFVVLALIVIYNLCKITNIKKQ